MKRWWVLGGLLAASPAAAQRWDIYGFNPRATSMGGVQASAEDDFTAAYYNPALLGKGAVGLGFDWGRPNVFVNATGTPGAGQLLSPKLPPDFAAYNVGAAIPLGGRLKDLATIGFGMTLPARQLFRTGMIDESVPYFYRYDSGPDRNQVFVAASVHPWPFLSIGGGAQTMADYIGAADFSTIIGTNLPGRIVRRSLDNDITFHLAPTAGISAGPFRGFRLYGSFRGEMRSTYHLPIQVDLGNLGSLNVMVDGINHYTPNALVGGAAWTGLQDRLLVAVDLEFERWSVAPPPLATITIGLPNVLTALGFQQQILSQPVQMGFSDTYSPRVGAEWRQTDRLRIRGGYAFRPSPIPDQVGRTNFLDNDAHLLSAGAGYALDDPLRMATRLTLDGSVQYSVFAPRDVQKAGSNALPGYRFGGGALDLALAVRYEF